MHGAWFTSIVFARAASSLRQERVQIPPHTREKNTWRLRIYFLLFFLDGYRCPSHRQALAFHSPHRSPRLHSLHSLHCLRRIFAAPFFRRPRHLDSLHRLHRRRGLRIEVASVHDFRCLSPQRPQMVNVTRVNGFPLLLRQWYLRQRHIRHRFHWT